MNRVNQHLSRIALGAGFIVSSCLAQTSATAASPSAARAAQQPPPSSPPTDTKKAKKVWTNDDVSSTPEPPPAAAKNVRDTSKNPDTGRADAPYIANTKKQLEKLESQLRDTEKQLSDLKDFAAGKPAARPSGYQLGKGYNRVPVDQQMASLEDKKKQIQGKIDDLLDEARKKGVEPGQLR